MHHEIISLQPKIEEDDEEEMVDDAMNEMDDANAPRYVCALWLLSQAGISLHKL
ncbi:hypothetical protein RSAG8_04790, partial [Rhizoctonia solani AG-8 WAC10335]